jgi:hypothetical protein
LFFALLRLKIGVTSKMAMKKTLTKGEVQLEVFSGWKDIASYLGKGVRTIQRYEQTMGLPIRRPAGKMSGAVLATKAELDAWLAASPLRGTFQTQQRIADFEPIYKKFCKNIEDLKRIRAETRELRDRLTESLELLRTNLRLSLEERRARASHNETLFGEVSRFDSKKLQ